MSRIASRVLVCAIVMSIDSIAMASPEDPRSCTVTDVAGLFDPYAVPPEVGDGIELDLSQPALVTTLQFGAFAELAVPGLLVLRVDADGNRSYRADSATTPQTFLTLDVYDENTRSEIWLHDELAGRYVSDLKMTCVAPDAVDGATVPEDPPLGDHDGGCSTTSPHGWLVAGAILWFARRTRIRRTARRLQA